MKYAIILAVLIISSARAQEDEQAFLNLITKPGKTLQYKNINNSLIIYGDELRHLKGNIYWIKNCELIVNSRIHINLNRIITINNSVPFEQSVSGSGYLVESSENDNLITSLMICQADETGKEASDYIEIKFYGSTYIVNY